MFVAVLLAYIPLSLFSACTPVSAVLCVNGDDNTTAWVNGNYIGDFMYINWDSTSDPVCVNVPVAYLNAAGNNVIALSVTDTAGGQIWGTFALDVTCAGGMHSYLSNNDGGIKMSATNVWNTPPPNDAQGDAWNSLNYDDTSWANAVSVTVGVWGRPLYSPQDGQMVDPYSYSTDGSAGANQWDPSGMKMMYMRKIFTLNPEPPPPSPTITIYKSASITDQIQDTDAVTFTLTICNTGGGYTTKPLMISDHWDSGPGCAWSFGGPWYWNSLTDGIMQQSGNSLTVYYPLGMEANTCKTFEYVLNHCWFSPSMQSSAWCSSAVNYSTVTWTAGSSSDDVSFRLFCPSGTNTPTRTHTFNPTLTITQTATPTRTITNSPAITVTFTPTLTLTATYTATVTVTRTVTLSMTATVSPSFTTTITPSNTQMSTFTGTPTNTATATGSPTHTNTSQSSVTITGTNTPSNTATISLTLTATATASASSTPTGTLTASYTLSPELTATSTHTETASFTQTAFLTLTSTVTVTQSSTLTLTATLSPQFTSTATETATTTPTETQTATLSQTLTCTPSITHTETLTVFTFTATHTVTLSATPTFTMTQSPSLTVTATPSFSSTASPSLTQSPASSGTPTLTLTYTIAVTPSAVATQSATPQGGPVTIGIKLTASGENPEAGASVKYTIELSNNDISSASGITVWATIPAQMSYVSAENGLNPALNGNVIVFTLPAAFELAPGDRYRIEYNVIINSLDQAGVLVSSASADYNDIYYTAPLRHPPVISAACFYPAGNAVVFPNPFSISGSPYKKLKFDNLPPGSTIVIYTVSGEAVVSLNSRGIRYEWNGKNSVGMPVSPGIYYYLITNRESSQVQKGKLYIIK